MITTSADPSTRAPRPLLGLIVKVPATATIELAGHVGFDLVLIDTEHGPSDAIELEHHVRAADCVGLDALVRVSDAASPDILRALDAGAVGVVVPHAITAADVAHAASRAHYPPNGRRSLALSTRAARHGTRPAHEHVDDASARVRLIVQIEDREALEQIPQILGTAGLAGVFIGPADLAISLGRPGASDHPEVLDAIDQIATTTVAQAGVDLCVLARDAAEATSWIERGARIILFNAPALLAARLLEIVRETRADPNRIANTM